MIKTDNTVKFCYTECPPRQPCTCRSTSKYPKISEDKILDNKFGEKK